MKNTIKAAIKSYTDAKQPTSHSINASTGLIRLMINDDKIAKHKKNMKPATSTSTVPLMGDA